MRNNIAIGVLSLMLLIPAVGNAAGLYRDTDSRVAFPGEVYLGVKFGQFTVEQDVSGSSPFETDNLGFTFGGEINDILALEFEYTRTVSADKVDTGGGALSRFSTDSIGFFLVAKTDSDLYVKGRVGYTQVGQEVDFMGMNPRDTVYGVAYGLGAGLKIARGTAIEVEYTIYPDSELFFGVSVPGGMDRDMVSVNVVWSYE